MCDQDEPQAEQARSLPAISGKALVQGQESSNLCRSHCLELGDRRIKF